MSEENEEVRDTSLERKNFELMKIKVKKDTCEISYFDKTKGRGIDVDSPDEIHDDLRELLDSLKANVANVYRLNFPMMVLGNEDFDVTPLQSQFLTKYYNEVIDQITITGLTVGGKGENKSVIITAIFDTLQGGCSINTKQIHFGGSTLGCEEEVEKIFEFIEYEAYMHVFEDKVYVDPQRTIEQEIEEREAEQADEAEVTDVDFEDVDENEENED